MSNKPLIDPKVLESLPEMILATTVIVSYINTLRTIAQQAGEWTPDQEASFQGMLDAAKVAPHWQPDPPDTGENTHA